MYEQVEKSKENKSSSIANFVAHRNRKGAVNRSLDLVDNRSDFVAQRKLRIGNSYDFLGQDQQIPETLVAGIAAMEVLNKMKNSALVYSFSSIEELQDLATAIGAVEGSPQLIMRALDDPLFIHGFAQSQLWLHIMLGNWIIEQMHSLSETVRNVDRDNEFYTFRQQIFASISPERTLEVLVAVFRRIIYYQTTPFVLNENRVMNEEHGSGSIEDQRYGYHLTKIHNLKGIRSMGLQPREGAGEGGSLAMSTSEQQIGSQKTSEGMIAYGLHPETFRPYINQFEDRRQMIEGQPIELKPVMLRFLITHAVRERGVQLPSEGVYDYMDRTAINSDVAISPNLIEVLTPNGFVPILHFDHTQPNQILELRDEQDNARMGDQWVGQIAVFDYEQLSRIGVLMNLLGFNKNERQPSYIEEVTRLNELRDKGTVKLSNVTFTFRGATFQTSGNRHSWQYAFSITGKDIPNWLTQRVKDYHKNYLGLANSLIGRLDQEYENVQAPVIEDSELLKDYEIGQSSGLDLNCLLYTIDQLVKNTKKPSQERVDTMRQVLAQAGYTEQEGEIDIYGGAGMQLANDLGVRLQVHQRVGSGQYVEHPILGSSGPVLHILHRSRHFAPLWPAR